MDNSVDNAADKASLAKIEQSLPAHAFDHDYDTDLAAEPDADADEFEADALDDEPVDTEIDDATGGDGDGGEDIAAAALAGARHNAHTRPRRYDRETRRRIRRENLAGRNPGTSGRNAAGFSGPGADPARDPHRIGGLLGNFMADQGWERPLAEARVFADWAELVGSDIAAHANPQSLTAGELRIAAESTAWATQLRLLQSRVLARLVAELGPDVVTKLIITGPAAPSWKHGNRSVRGHRGPRDTYG